MSNKILKKIKESKEIYPLSFYELDIRLKETSETIFENRVFTSKKYKDSDFHIAKFYKPISKF